MSKLFDRALKKVFKEQNEIEVELYPEFVGQGSYRQVDEAVSKLINFHDVDVITGIVSSKVVTELSEKFKDKDVLFLPNNLGAQLMNPENLPGNILLNSTHLWQQIWSLGHWSAKQFGSKAMFVGGPYDMAYCFTHMLDLGMRTVDPDCHWSFAVSHMPEEGELVSNPGVVFEYIEEEMPDFLFAAFCGQEASLFLDEYIERGLHKKIPLVTTPYLLEDFSQSVAEPLTIYTTQLAGRQLLTEDLDAAWALPKGVFSMLGNESAQIILDYFGKEGSEILSGRPYETGRGRVDLTPHSAGENTRVFILENQHPGNKSEISRKIVAEADTTNISNKEIVEGLQQVETSWHNVYLGV